MAKKSLLASPARSSLSDNIAEVGLFADSVERMRAGLTTFGSDSDALSSCRSGAVAAVSGALEAAKQCLLIVACATCVEEFVNQPRGREMAETLLKKGGGGIPEALRKRLTSMALA